MRVHVVADLLTSKQNASIPAREKICHDTYSHPSRSYWTPFEVLRKLFRGNNISVSTFNDRSVTSSSSYCLLPKLLPWTSQFQAQYMIRHMDISSRYQSHLRWMVKNLSSLEGCSVKLCDNSWFFLLVAESIRLINEIIILTFDRNWQCTQQK